MRYALLASDMGRRSGVCKNIRAQCVMTDNASVEHAQLKCCPSTPTLDSDGATVVAGGPTTPRKCDPESSALQATARDNKTKCRGNIAATGNEAVLTERWEVPVLQPRKLQEWTDMCLTQGNERKKTKAKQHVLWSYSFTTNAARQV